MDLIFGVTLVILLGAALGVAVMFGHRRTESERIPEEKAAPAEVFQKVFGEDNRQGIVIYCALAVGCALFFPEFLFGKWIWMIPGAILIIGKYLFLQRIRKLIDCHDSFRIPYLTLIVSIILTVISLVWIYLILKGDFPVETAYAIPVVLVLDVAVLWTYWTAMMRFTAGFCEPLSVGWRRLRTRLTVIVSLVAMLFLVMNVSDSLAGGKKNQEPETVVTPTPTEPGTENNTTEAMGRALALAMVAVAKAVVYLWAIFALAIVILVVIAVWLAVRERKLIDWTLGELQRGEIDMHKFLSP